MCVTDICREEIEFNLESGTWKEEKSEKDYEKDIKKYNDSKQRFLAYQWGIWVTAYARANLWNGILAIKEDYCYSDTDSIKLINPKEHSNYFTDYNERIVKKLHKMLDHYNLPHDAISPKTIKGEIKTIGLWDYEFTCDFKTLGAKRYVERRSDNKLYLTVSGINKDAVQLLDNNIDNFKDGFNFDKDADCVTKKLCTYLDNITECKFDDGYINKYKHGINLRRTGYLLTLTDEYKHLINYLDYGFENIDETVLNHFRGTF